MVTGSGTTTDEAGSLGRHNLNKTLNTIQLRLIFPARHYAVPDEYRMPKRPFPGQPAPISSAPGRDSRSTRSEGDDPRGTDIFRSRIMRVTVPCFQLVTAVRPRWLAAPHRQR
jgi:hypothetical protein